MFFYCAIFLILVVFVSAPAYLSGLKICYFRSKRILFHQGFVVDSTAIIPARYLVWAVKSDGVTDSYGVPLLGIGISGHASARIKPS